MTAMAFVKAESPTQVQGISVAWWREGLLAPFETHAQPAFLGPHGRIEDEAGPALRLAIVEQQGPATRGAGHEAQQPAGATDALRRR